MLRTVFGALSAPRPAYISALFLTAILLGSATGVGAEATGTALSRAVDPLVLLLVGTLLFSLRFEGWRELRRAPKTVALALLLNFALIPLIALVLTRLLVPDEALRLGVLIYCLFPCTDWFLGFTRLAGGNTTVGAALIPVQLTLQLLLYPAWIGVLTQSPTPMASTGAVATLLTWFAAPAAIALGLRLLLLPAPVAVRRGLIEAVDTAVPLVIAALIFALFAANVATIRAAPLAFGWVLLTVFVFFMIMYLLGLLIARGLRLDHGTHALLTMTTSARNAPLMLGLTTVALPDQPLVAAAIILGMLVEFPHLTVLTHLLQRERAGGGRERRKAALPASTAARR